MALFLIHAIVCMVIMYGSKYGHSSTFYSVGRIITIRCITGLGLYYSLLMHSMKIFFITNGRSFLDTDVNSVSLVCKVM